MITIIWTCKWQSVLKFLDVFIILLLILSWKYGQKSNRSVKSLLTINIFGFSHETVAETDTKQLGMSNKID